MFVVCNKRSSSCVSILGSPLFVRFGENNTVNVGEFQVS